MVDTAKRNKRQNDWIKANRERINVTFAPGTKERIKAAAARDGISSARWLQAVINDALDKTTA